ncbi:MAG: pentapeptide repeat-containing protein [Truepera sp.]|nr:pentapeptide repeat-containing protein [Truepera sp.]
MDNSPNTSFWIALLEITDEGRRKRLWNGYLGQYLPEKVLAEPDYRSWPTGWVEPPADGWPQLTDEDTQFLDRLASERGGHPVFTHGDYMDFRKHTFRETVDFSGLTLVGAHFDEAKFEGDVDFSRARFFHQAWFGGATFKQRSEFWDTRFVAPVYFKDAEFESWAEFVRVQFEGGAAFANAVFQYQARFNESVFSERYGAGRFYPLCLADFKGAKFMSRSLFKEVQFGTTSARHEFEPQRSVDFSEAVFCDETDFRKAVFVGPPGFFGAQLHRDTDFHEVTWLESREPYTSYNIRAWEQLELMMSELEKPQDRHRFYRLRMRALRRQRGNSLFAVLNRLFELVADYGWGVQRAFGAWLSHWAVSAFVLFVSATPALREEDRARFFLAALATGFSNAHTFLGLTSENGYLAAHRSLVEAHAAPAVVQLVGTGQAVLGPILLFLLLLALRNRFRLV